MGCTDSQTNDFKSAPTISKEELAEVAGDSPSRGMFSITDVRLESRPGPWVNRSSAPRAIEK